jgi:predicted ester cyclase
MDATDHLELVRRCFDELFRARDFAAFERHCAERFFDHNPPAGAREGGIASTREGLRRLLEGLPDLEARIDDLLAQGDLVFVRSTFTGTHLGELMGLQPTGKRLKLEIWHLFRVRDGKLAEHRAQSDTIMLLRQVAASARQMADVVLIQPPDFPTTLA